MQWLIDIIKEWIEAEGYALESWVTLHFTPVNVSGELTPDATCTYFYAGTYNSKPYYKRSDGAYFIWWHTIDQVWYITAELRRPASEYWSKSGSIIGNYDPVLPATGTATVAYGYKLLCTGFVDRGDPADYDYTQANFTIDNAWHTKDLSGIVPTGAKAITVSLLYTATLVGERAVFRRHGNTNFTNVSDTYTQVTNVWIGNDIIVAVDSDRKIDYKFSANVTALFFTVKGWWL